MIGASPLRFFLTVAPTPVWVRVGLLVVVLVGTTGLLLDGREVDSAYGMTLFLQMFAASNGFGRDAARGHFDPLLVSGRSRWMLGCANCAAASLPGALAWLFVTAIALGAGGVARETALAPNRHLAFALVSSVSWAAGLTLPRFAAGALWSAILVGLALSRSGLADFMPVLHQVPRDALDVGKATAALSICPFLLLDRTAAVSDVRVWTVTAVFVGVVLAAGVDHVRRREYGLVEGE